MSEDIWNIQTGAGVWVYKDWELWDSPCRQFVVLDIAPSRLFVAINAQGMISPHDFVLIEAKNKQVEELEKLARCYAAGSPEWRMVKDKIRAIRTEQAKTDTQDMTLGHVRSIGMQQGEHGAFCVIEFTQKLNQDPRIGGRIWRVKGRNRAYINEISTERFHDKLKDRYGSYWEDFIPQHSGPQILAGVR